MALLASHMQTPPMQQQVDHSAETVLRGQGGARGEIRRVRDKGLELLCCIVVRCTGANIVLNCSQDRQPGAHTIEWECAAAQGQAKVK